MNNKSGGCLKNRSAPSFQILIQKIGFGALHFYAPLFWDIPSFRDFKIFIECVDIASKLSNNLDLMAFHFVNAFGTQHSASQTV